MPLIRVLQDTDDKTKQKIASQMKLAETAFIKPVLADTTFETGIYFHYV